MANNRTSNLWDDLKTQKWFQVLLVVGLVILSYIIVKKVKADTKTKGVNLDNQEAAAELGDGTGMSSEQALQRLLELKEIAELMSAAFWGWYTILFGSVVLWRAGEDEEAFIYQAQRIQNAKEAGFVSDYYKQYNLDHGDDGLGLSLKKDAEKYLSSNDLKRIATIVKNNWR